MKSLRELVMVGLVMLAAGSVLSCSAPGPKLPSEVSLTLVAARAAHPGVDRLLQAALAFAVVPETELHPERASRSVGLLRSADVPARPCILECPKASSGPGGARFSTLVLLFDPEQVTALEQHGLELVGEAFTMNAPPDLEVAAARGWIILTSARGGVVFPEAFERIRLLVD